MTQAFSQVFAFIVVISILLVGVDFMAKGAGPRVHGGYRRGLSRFERAIRERVVRFANWAWLGYHQFIIGVGVGIMLALYFLGRFP